MSTISIASTAWPHHWWFLFVPLIWVVTIALLLRFVVFRRGFGCWASGGGRGARGILAERYARGEIGDDEYRTRLDRLRADGER